MTRWTLGVMLLSQLFELQRLHFARIKNVELPSTRAIRRWMRFEGREDFCRLVKEVEGDIGYCSPTKEQLERLGLSFP
jgi:hypothetical protein